MSLCVKKTLFSERMGAQDEAAPFCPPEKTEFSLDHSDIHGNNQGLGSAQTATETAGPNGRIAAKEHHLQVAKFSAFEKTSKAAEQDPKTPPMAPMAEPKRPPRTLTEPKTPTTGGEDGGSGGRGSGGREAREKG